MLEAVKAVSLAVSQGRDRLQQLADRQRVLGRRLLAAAALVEWNVAKGKPEDDSEAAVHGRLESLCGAVDRGSELQVRVDRLLAAAEARGTNDASETCIGAGSGSSLGPADIAKVARQLEQSHRAIDQLLGIVRKDARDLSIMKKTLADLS